MRLALLGIVLTCFSALADDSKMFDEIMLTSKQSFELPFATAVAVVKNDQIVYEGYYGYTDINNQVKTNQNSPFYIASVTKPFFALTALMTEHQGHLDTRTSLKELFTDIQFGNIPAEKIATTHLLSHTSGINGNSMVWPLAYTGLHDAKLRKRLVETLTLNQEFPFDTFDYTNVGYTILSVWYENALDTSWQDALAKQVLKPLKMTQSKTAFPGNIAKPYALPYSTTSAQPKTPLYLMKQSETMHAAGGMVSTARDLSRFVIAQLNKGRVDGKQVFPAMVIEKSQKAVTEVPNPSNRKRTFTREGYAWGWYTGHFQEHRALHHGGGFPGASAHISFLPDQRLGVILLNNEGRLGDTLNKFIANAIYSYLLGEEEILETLQAEITDLKPKFDGFAKRVSESRRARSGKALNLTSPVADYVGEYLHPLAGVISIEKHGEGLKVSWGNLHGTAQFNETPDTVRLELVPEMGKVMAFKLSESKSVTLLTFDEMTFEKI